MSASYKNDLEYAVNPGIIFEVVLFFYVVLKGKECLGQREREYLNFYI